MLDDKRVAITGRLAFTTRAQAIDLIHAHGGKHVKEVGRSTSHLVVGRKGWPLARNGRLTRDLEVAQRLQQEGSPIAIVTEEEFLVLVGLEDRKDSIRRLYTTEQLSRILEVPLTRLRAWMHSELIRPVRTVHRLAYFDFEQVASAKALSELVRQGVRTAELRRSLEQLRRWLPGAANSLAQVGILEHGGRLYVQLEDGRLAEPSGQLTIDFAGPEAESAPAPLALSRAASRRPATDWFELAMRHEELSELEAAAEAYHQAMLVEGPQAEMAFNLGNVLYAIGSKEAAAQRFMQAVEMDGRYVESWNNLGIVLGELGRLSQAVEAFEHALELAPEYADAHYNLAEALHRLGRRDEAREHWIAYLEQDPNSSWARHVQARLAESGAGDREVVLGRGDEDAESPEE
ncbi:MAG: tetratricopeptide repeat protein [Planctomycetota bacterium]